MTAYVSIDDTSDTEVSKQKEINISIVLHHQIASLPMELNRTLVACSYQGIHTKNNYDANGNLINSTVEITTQEINVSSSGTETLYATLKQRDIYEAEYLCYWSDTMNDEMFQIWMNDTTLSQKYLSCSLDIGFPSWICKACARQDYEEIVTEYTQAQQTSSDYLKLYLLATNLTTMLTTFWLVVYWTIRVFIILVLIGFAFATIIWMYHFIRKMAEQM
jgi:hypothetical protein